MFIDEPIDVAKTYQPRVEARPLPLPAGPELWPVSLWEIAWILAVIVAVRLLLAGV